MSVLEFAERVVEVMGSNPRIVFALLMDDPKVRRAGYWSGGRTCCGWSQGLGWVKG